MLRRTRILLVAAVAALSLAVSAATASATSVEFSRAYYAAPLGQAFPDPISVTVTDEIGEPVSGAEVAFSVTPDATGATATISGPTATTDGDGVAQVTGTAGTEAGFPKVHAAVDGASADATLVNRPPGYRPGEKLASIVAENQDGVTEDVRDSLSGGTFLLVDVCAGWCVPCQEFAQETETAITQLAVLGVKFKTVTLLVQGSDELLGPPSVQSDAQTWKSENAVSGSVLHAGGSADSALYRGGTFFSLNDEGFTLSGFPTHLLVDPKGNILDRVAGADSAQETVDRVLAHTKTKTVKPPKPGPPIGEVGVQLPSGATHSELFTEFGSHDSAFGQVSLGGEDVNGIAQRTWGYVTPPPFAPLAASGTLTTSLTRFKAEARQRLTSPTVTARGGMRLGFATVIQANTTLPAVQNAQSGTVTVAADLVALRSAMRDKIEAGDFQVTVGNDPSPLTPEQIDALVDSLFGFQVEASYTIK